MKEEYKIKIGDREFEVEEVTFAKLDEIKTELGFDFTGGLTDEQRKNMFTDFKKTAKAVAIIVYKPQKIYSLEATADYIYKHGKISDFVRVFDFFGKAIKQALSDIRTTLPASQKPEKNKK
jgi:hypothetical protein